MPTLKQSYQNWRSYRKTCNELHQMSDRELNDIGISRGDIPFVARRARQLTSLLTGPFLLPEVREIGRLSTSSQAIGQVKTPTGSPPPVGVFPFVGRDASDAENAWQH